jgi:hypothetical protein
MISEVPVGSATAGATAGAAAGDGGGGDLDAGGGVGFADVVLDLLNIDAHDRFGNDVLP